MAARGSCYGFAIHSDLAFSYLRAGGGTDVLEVQPTGDGGDGPPGRLLREWAPPVVPFRARLHADGSSFRLWVGGAGWFQVDPTRGRIGVPVGAEPVRREERLWGLPALLCFLHRGDLPLHAAAIELDGGAVLLAAPGFHGKTTLAAAFVAAGHRLLTEDLVCLRGSSLEVLPGPAMLRLRPDVGGRIDLPRAEVLSRTDGRIHLSLRACAGDGGPVPLRGIVLLDGHDEPPTIAPEPIATALRELWSLSFNLPHDDDRERCFSGLTKLVTGVPVWRLRRRLAFDDLRPTVEVILDACTSG